MALIGLAVFVAIVAGFAVGLSSKRLAKRVGDKTARIVTWLKHLIHKRPGPLDRATSSSASAPRRSSSSVAAGTG